MSFGALAFLNPWLLAGLATLPLIYLLLRTVPPRPRQVEFPATRILVGLDNEEKTSATTPWWLLLIRLSRLRSSFCTRTTRAQTRTGARPQGLGAVVVVRARQWVEWSFDVGTARKAMAERFISEAQSAARAA